MLSRTTTDGIGAGVGAAGKGADDPTTLERRLRSIVAGAGANDPPVEEDTGDTPPVIDRVNVLGRIKPESASKSGNRWRGHGYTLNSCGSE